MFVADPSSGLVIEASSAEELSAAYETLSNTEGGGWIELTSDADGIEIDLRGGGNEAVHITSADGENPVTVARIATHDVENVRFADLEVFSGEADRPDWHGDLNIASSRGIEIENINFSSTATGFYDPTDPEARLGESFGSIRNSHDVSFVDNTVSDYFQGLTLLESTGLEVRDNEFTGIQGDGIRMGGVQDVVISGNYLHDFHGTVQTVTHTDMIQMWSRGTDQISSNVTISDNILDTGSGAGYQTIFLSHDKNWNAETSEYYSDITVTNNLIHTSSSHGITVTGANGVEVSGNTVLLNADATMVAVLGADGVSRVPVIRLEHVADGVVTDNIAGGYTIDGATQSGNYTINYDNPNSPDYVGTHFVGVTKGTEATLVDLRLRPDSDWLDAGSDYSAPLTQSVEGVTPVVTTSETAMDLEVIVFDASFSVNEAGFVDPEAHTFRWHFEDGTIREGVQVAHRFEEVGSQDVRLEILSGNVVLTEEMHSVDVYDNTFLSLDFSNGVEDGSSYGAILTTTGAIVDGAQGNGFRIGGDDQIDVTRENAHFHNLESFGISLDMQLLDGDAGRFLHFQNVMQGTINEDGQVSFCLDTSDGRFIVDSGDVTIQDDAFHKIAFGYSDQAGVLELMIDGEVVGQVEASGVTAAQGAHGFVIGSKFWAAPDAVVDNIHFGLDPADAGVQIDGAGIDPAIIEASLVDTSPVETAAVVAPATEEVYVSIDFEDGLVDTSGNDSTLKSNPDGRVEDGFDGKGYHIATGVSLEIHRRNEQLEELDDFRLSLDIQMLDSDQSGRFVHYARNFEAIVEDDGSITFELNTDQGMFELNSGAVTFADGVAHNFTVEYSSQAGALSMSIDDTLVDQTAASGETFGALHNGFVIGSKWGDAVDALIDNVEFASLEPDTLSDPEAATLRVDFETVKPQVLPTATDLLAAPQGAPQSAATSSANSHVETVEPDPLTSETSATYDTFEFTDSVAQIDDDLEEKDDLGGNNDTPWAPEATITGPLTGPPTGLLTQPVDLAEPVPEQVAEQVVETDITDGLAPEPSAVTEEVARLKLLDAIADMMAAQDGGFFGSDDLAMLQSALSSASDAPDASLAPPDLQEDIVLTASPVSPEDIEDPANFAGTGLALVFNDPSTSDYADASGSDDEAEWSNWDHM